MNAQKKSCSAAGSMVCVNTMCDVQEKCFGASVEFVFFFCASQCSKHG